MKMTSIFTTGFLLIIGIKGCFPEIKESPTKGYLLCYTDESLLNLINDEKAQFEKLYPESKIDIKKMKAREGIAAVLNGDTKLFVSSRSLNPEEKEFIDKTKSDVKIFKFCYDAVAVIEKENGHVEQMETEHLKKHLLGLNNNLKVFVPEANSGVYEYLKQDFLQGKELAGVVVVESELEVIENVKRTKNSIGLVGIGVLENQSGVDVVEIGLSGRSISGLQFYEPMPAYMVNGSYPLVRTCYLLLNEVNLHLASGFTTFLTSYDGQKIALENNLAPATVPVKLVP